MCDNIVAVGSATADGSVIFGKNSDREPNEPHMVTIIPRAAHEKGSIVHCTYIDIPQVEETNAVLLCRPSWLWGAEMGANDRGVTIGNTAVFTREEYDTRPGLIGMDFLRLALERADSAKKALEQITTLLETYGQSGNNGFAHELYYHNSFMIADAQEAWVLETIGSRWVAKKVQDVAATSNTLTITTEWDLASDDLIEYARDKGWANAGGDFNVKESYSGPGFYVSYIYNFFGHGDERHARLTGLLQEQIGNITVPVMMNALRDHGALAGEDYNPAVGLNQNPPCMHASFGPIRVGQTTGSLISQIARGNQTHFVTATSAPCLSTFKPVWLDIELPDMGQVPTSHYNRSTLWWRHEELHRATLLDYQTRCQLSQNERDELEVQFLNGVKEMVGETAERRSEFVSRCFAQADQALERWNKRVLETPVVNRLPKGYQKHWQKLSQESGYNFGFRKDSTSSPSG
ncbi:MAG: C69 family dipeptidase [Candidatus Promineifilaceae bacterium]|nr:C69 family dipeptidase [Candidatus Promineifilaceae bacterium]